MKGINVGEFSTPVTFQEKPNVGVTEFNTKKKSDWQDVPVNANTWCRILKKAPGDEGMENGRFSNIQGIMIWIRFREDLDAKMSFLIDEIRYFINDIHPPAGYRRSILEIDARKSE